MLACDEPYRLNYSKQSQSQKIITTKIIITNSILYMYVCLTLIFTTFSLVLKNLVFLAAETMYENKYWDANIVD